MNIEDGRVPTSCLKAVECISAHVCVRELGSVGVWERYRQKEREGGKEGGEAGR